ncbi:type I restriction enzyme S subunit [Yonghaparkia alkaliphila]|uniref:Type I restriction enzyme S subunit n=2 Tax=Microcella alkalica TaxID=355930 RepID=A0A839E7W2_9MICO|nr:type I restriction enzyme S subunit [Microcella alkalica]
MATNQGFKSLIPDRSRLDEKYLYWWLVSNKAALQRLGVGATFKEISKAIVSRVVIPLPPLPEQRRIASILDEARAVGRLADKQLESLSELRDALIESAEASSDSIHRTVSSIIDRIDSGKSPVCEDREAREGEWGVLKLGAISSGTYRTDGNTKALREDTVPLTHLEVKAGDVLLSRKNTPELVGASAYVRHTRSRLLLPDLIFRLVVNADAGVIPAYLQAMLSAPRTRAKLRKVAGGSAASMSNISKARLSLVTVPVASLRVQEELVSSLQQVVELTDAVMARKIMSEQLASALQTRAFKGEL